MAARIGNCLLLSEMKLLLLLMVDDAVDGAVDAKL